ncbi:MAG: transcriptional repressor [Paludibacteraceae bacterium]|nr:transcriptional repressor [Paludibacteraceae bacterium]
MFDAISYLQQYGIRPSSGRVAVLNDLESHRTHSTVDEIYARLKSDKDISLASVYNTLNLLVAKKVIKSIQFEDKVTRYDFSRQLHAHFRCIKCGKIVDIPVSRRATITLPPDFKLEEEDYLISGLCSDCSKDRD